MSTSDIRRYGDNGIHTVEGQVSGAAAAALAKESTKQRLEYEEQKRKIKEQNSLGLGKLDDKFSTHESTTEENKYGYGLVITAEELRKSRESTQAAKEQNEIIKKQDENEKRILKDQKRKKMQSSLSFGDDEDFDDNDDNTIELKKKRTKNPEVDTSFLPDAIRDKEIEDKKVSLREEWLSQQEIIKNEMLDVDYSYYDGTGHRKKCTVKKGTTIGKFLEQVKSELSKEFHELRMTSSDSLLYVKEDLIIPHHFSFYDLIITKARGKSGPLFHFDVHDDVRLLHDARVEKDESHPGKVIERKYFERNKHVFPLSRYEVYDPSKSYDKYTIHGGEIR